MDWAPSQTSVDLQLDLQFEASAGRTRVKHRKVRYPYSLTTALNLDQALDGVATVIVQSASGGIFECDRLHQRIVLREKARACVTTQGATVVHEMRGETYAESRIAICSHEMSYVEFRPHPLVMFPGSRLRQRLNVWLADGAAAVLSDGFLNHDPAADGRCFAWLDSAMEVRRADGRLIAADRVNVGGEAALDGLPGISRGVNAHGWVLVVAPLTQKSLAGVFAKLSQACKSITGLYFGASSLGGDEGFFIRIAAEDGSAMRNGVHAALSLARQNVLDTTPSPRLP